jgi:hypothetical protein
MKNFIKGFYYAILLLLAASGASLFVCSIIDQRGVLTMITVDYVEQVHKDCELKINQYKDSIIYNPGKKEYIDSANKYIIILNYIK